MSVITHRVGNRLTIEFDEYIGTNSIKHLSDLFDKVDLSVQSVSIDFQHTKNISPAGMSVLLAFGLYLRHSQKDVTFINSCGLKTDHFLNECSVICHKFIDAFYENRYSEDIPYKEDVA